MLAMIFSPSSPRARQSVTCCAHRPVRPIPLRFDDHRRLRDRAGAARSRPREQRRARATTWRAPRETPAATPAPTASIAMSGTM